MLAHELTHVVQQATAPLAIPTANNGIAPADGPHEQQAEAATRSIGNRPLAAPARLPAPNRMAAAIQRAPEPPAVDEQEIAISVSLSGIDFQVPERVVFKPGKKSTQLLIVVLRGLLGPKYTPGLEQEAEAALPWGRLKREGEFKSKELAKGGEPFPQIHFDLGATAALFAFLRKKKLEPRLSNQQKELLRLGVANVGLWEEFRCKQLLRRPGGRSGTPYRRRKSWERLYSLPHHVDRSLY